MTEKRFRHSITLQGEDEIWDSQTDVYFRVCGALKRLNELQEENKQLKQQLFETSKELLWATSDEVDRTLYYEDEVEELQKEIFE